MQATAFAADEIELRTAHLLVYRLYDGDATSQHTFSLARLLLRHGLDVSIICQEPIGRVPADIQPLARTLHFADYVADADLTILQYPIWYPLAERLRTATGVRVFWYHGVTPPELWSAMEERDILRTAQARTELAQFAHIAVAASPFTATELQHHAGLSSEQVRVVPLGVDVERFAIQPDKEELATLRRRWRLSASALWSDRHDQREPRVILFVGRIAGNKRLDILIDALALLSEDSTAQFADVVLLIVGDTQDGVATQALVRELRRHAQDAGVGARVIFTGRVDRVEPYYHLADVYVQSSQHEGFGVPLVEAMATGTPVIASRSGAMPWVLGTQEITAGLTFAAGDVDELVRHLRLCLHNNDSAHALADAGRKRARHFDVARFEERAWTAIVDACAMAVQDNTGQRPSVESSLLARADVARRDYRVSSALPVIGPLVAWLRKQSTVHLKEAYLDRIIERQVTFNRLLAQHILSLQDEADAVCADSRDSVPQPKASTARLSDVASARLDHANRDL